MNWEMEHFDMLAGTIGFRVATTERIRATVWNKYISQILTPHAFGVGWSINLYPLFHPKTA
jgi:hypothetical protein